MEFIGSVPVIGIGHNGGPPLDEPPRPSDWNHYCWKRAHKRAWKNPGREVMLLRLRRAEECGMTYREYTAVILDRGVYLQKDDVLPKKQDKDC
jgi:hypothetical protein